MSHLATILAFTGALILAAVGFGMFAVPAWFCLAMFAAGMLTGVTFRLERGPYGRGEQEIPLGQWREEEPIDFNQVERRSVA